MYIIFNVAWNTYETILTDPIYKVKYKSQQVLQILELKNETLIIDHQM